MREFVETEKVLEQTGTVGVRKVVHEEQQAVTARGYREFVETERRPVNQRVEHLGKRKVCGEARMEIDDTQPHGRHRPQHRFEQLYIDLFQYPMERDGLLIWAGAETPGFDLSELTGPGCLHSEVLLF